MAKLTRLQRSNNAHKRLEKKHDKKRLSSKGRERDIAFVKTTYHSRVLYTQKKIGRVLSQKEKRAAYEDIIKTFF